MQTNIKIQDELKALSPLLAAMEKVNVFSVPEHYFANLSSQISNVITKANDVPEGYFENLADNILNRIKKESAISASEEIKYLSPALYATGNENVFTVPHSYFQNNVTGILSQMPQPAKVVEMKKRPAFFKYAAAAVISGMIGLSVFSIFDKKTNSEELLPSTSVVTTGEEKPTDSNFDKMLETVSDDEIVQYLENNGEDVNTALVASATEEGNLPGEEDYLLDENALDNFLNDNNIKNTTN